MSDRATQRCPRCGAEMNCHAEKLDPSRAADDPAADAALGGVLLEIHTCPVCKFVLEREAR
jgi:ssDNA-binding Zn-finger/Zn-ribbon topoisomerase 1